MNEPKEPAAGSDQSQEFINALAQAQALYRAKTEEALLVAKAQAEAQAEAEAQYQFWTKIISDEVARKRFNEGFEPIDVDLYKSQNAQGKVEYVGKVRICGRDFRCRAKQATSSEGQQILRLSIRVQQRQNH